jgi:para-nitrobenzyl esterase
LLASPLAKGLFHRAIAESGGCVPIGTYARPLKTAGMNEGSEEQGVRYATALGCTSGDILVCMRGKDAKTILNALPAIVGVLSQGERYGFTIDGDALPDSPNALTKSGNYNKVPIIEGTNADEGSIFTLPLGIMNDIQYQAAINAGFGANAAAVLGQYPSSNYPSAKAALDAVVTDSVFACPARRKDRDFAMYQSEVWLYQFQYVPSYATLLGIGAFHGSEIDFALGTLVDRKTAVKANAEEMTLSAAMMGYWTSFAKTGAPNGAVMWPKYDAASDTSIGFAATITTTTGLKKAKCDFWDGL